MLFDIKIIFSTIVLDFSSATHNLNNTKKIIQWSDFVFKTAKLSNNKYNVILMPTANTKLLLPLINLHFVAALLPRWVKSNNRPDFDEIKRYDQHLKCYY